MKTTYIICLLILMGVLACQKKKEDVYLYLTQEQKDYINNVKEGDTAVWLSSTGLKDTAVVNSFIHERIFSSSYENPKINIEMISYSYKICGKNKLSLNPQIGVQTLINEPNTIERSFLYGGIETKGIINKRMFGGIYYDRVFWTTFRDGSDTVFWNAKGFLGKSTSEVVIEKIR
jgi:hypothetical protein